MVIRRSSTGEVQQLLAAILAPGGVEAGTHDAAIARLRVIGDRAVRPVVAALEATSDPGAQTRLLHVLDGRTEAAVAAIVTRALDSPEAAVRAAAVPVARGLLDAAVHTEVLDRLVARAVDASEAQPVRLAAITALATLPGSAVKPILARLTDDPDPAVRLAVARRGDTAGGDEPGDEIEDAARGGLPADPQRLLDALARDGSLVPLPTLHHLVTVVREKEQAERRAPRRREWLTVRGAIHHALAVRDSRVALYDIRETLEAADGPLPMAFADAAALVGDAACLEALATAWARSEGHDEWRAALLAAGAAIARRQRLTSRSALVRRLRAKWGDALSTPSRTALS